MFTGTSGSLLLQPREFIESRNEADAMLGNGAVCGEIEATGVEGLGRAWVDRSLFCTGTHRDGGEAAGRPKEAFRGAAAGDARYPGTGRR